MQGLISFLKDAPLTASCLGEASDDAVDLHHGIYGLHVTPDYGPDGMVPGRYQATTFKMENNERVRGHHTDILDDYWYTDLTPDGLIKVFEQLVKLA